MKAWLHSNFSYIAGTAEPIYGPEAIVPVQDTIEDRAYSELVRSDYKWEVPSSSHVETETFYVTADSGLVCFAQIIHSNLNSWTTTAYFTCRVFDKDNTYNIFTSTLVPNYGFEGEENCNFCGDGAAITLSEDMTRYTLDIDVCADTVVHMTLDRTAPGFKVGANGVTSYGTDHANPWATMRHTFWPRARTAGHVTVRGEKLDMQGHGMMAHALQNGKPQHLASSWKFANFQGPQLSAIMMEFTTPPSYGSTRVSVGGIARDGEIIACTVDNDAVVKASEHDDDTAWEEPTAMSFEWRGHGERGEQITARTETELGERFDRVDIMAEIPAWLKSLVHGVSGTRPFIYQYGNRVTLTLQVDDEQAPIKEEGVLFNEVTFIS